MSVEEYKYSSKYHTMIGVGSGPFLLDNIAKQVIRHCSDVFDFKIICLSDVDNLAAVFFAGIDCYVCASKIEGTPAPILESMACGVPFISTCVGIVPEAAGELQSRFILKERSKDALKEKIIELLEHPELLPQLSQENLASIRNWEWRDRIRRYIPMWKDAMGK